MKIILIALLFISWYFNLIWFLSMQGLLTLMEDKFDYRPSDKEIRAANEKAVRKWVKGR